MSSSAPAPSPRTILEPGDVVSRAAWPADADVRSLHVVRIGGAGMSAVARLALEAGLAVSGSDSQDGQFIAPLRAAGARIGIGFDAALLAPDLDALAVSTAVRADNPEVRAARERGIPVLHRAAVLAGLLGDRRVLAVAGTHGKTSTTAMATMALRGGGEDPAWALGAAVPMLGRNAGLGTTGTAVLEADESDGSFLAFAPDVLVVTNLEPDHLDFHGTPEHLTAAFDALVARIPAEGTLVVCGDDPGAAALGDRAARRGVRVERYGTGAGDAWRLLAEEATASGTRVVLGTPEGEVTGELSVFGHHNALNALGALAAARAMRGPSDGNDGVGADGTDVAGGGVARVPVQALLDGILPFTGASRRFEKKGTAGGVTVYDDYAHHPREVEATVSAARGIVGEGRVLVVFQPHLFSRTRDFAGDFARTLALADVSLVMPVYAAREDPDPATTARTITDLAPAGAELEPLEDRTEVADRVAEIARPGDLVLMLGAGDVVDVTPAVLDALGGPGAPEGASR